MIPFIAESFLWLFVGEEFRHWIARRHGTAQSYALMEINSPYNQ
jgi:hypothetical protein